MAKFDKIELEAIRTLVRSKVHAAVKIKEDERNKKRSEAQAAFSELNNEICKKIRCREQKKIEEIMKDIRKEYPLASNLYGRGNNCGTEIHTIGVQDGEKLTVNVRISGTISLDIVVEVPEEDGKEWTAARDALNATNGSSVVIKHEDIDVALAEVILTDRANMMGKIDEIVAGILKKSGV